MTITETSAQRYERLAGEQYQLHRIEPEKRTPEQAARVSAVRSELLEIVATAPDGYCLPKLADDLVTLAQAHGWQTLAQWTPPGYSGEPYVTVQVGRLISPAERESYRGDRWAYKLTWHSRNCPAGKVRLFGQGTAVTPDDPSGRAGAPSVRAIRAVIAAHPAPAAVES